MKRQPADRRASTVRAVCRVQRSRRLLLEALENKLLLAAYDLDKYDFHRGDDDLPDRPVVANYSSVAYHPPTQSLFIIDNAQNSNNGAIHEYRYGFDGAGTYTMLHRKVGASNVPRVINLAGFDLNNGDPREGDPEGIVWKGPFGTGQEFAFIREQMGIYHNFFLDIDGSYDADLLVDGDTTGPSGTGAPDDITDRITNGSSSITSSTATPNPTADGDADPNNGLEGLAYDPADNLFYAVKEFNWGTGGSNMIFQITPGSPNAPTTALTVATAPGGQPLRNVINDASDIFYAAGHLFVISEAGATDRISRVTNVGGTWTYNSLDPASTLQLTNPPGFTIETTEGLSFSPDGFELFIVGEPARFYHYRNYTGYTPAAAPDLADYADNNTSDTTPTFEGVAPEGATVRLYFGANEVAVVKLDPGDTTYSITPTAPQADATYAVTVKFSDELASPTTRHSLPSPAASITIDTRQPSSAAPDGYLADEDTPLVVAAPGVLTNDSDPDDDELVAVLVEGPAHGDLLLESDGGFTYTPSAEFSGQDTFTYRPSDGVFESPPVVVTIEVRPVNDPPVSLDDEYTVDSAILLTVPAPGVLENDDDVDIGPLNAQLVSAPTHGQLTFAPDGSFTYRSDTRFSGQDQFTYRASDGQTFGDPATVTITVRPVVIGYLSFANDVQIAGLATANEDVLAFDGMNFTMHFDGSDVGLEGVAIDALAVVAADVILLSFDRPTSLPSISGGVDDSDIVRFTASSLGDATSGTFSMYFDGSDVGLTTENEDVDALELLAGGDLLISTAGSANVPGIPVQDEDLLRFTPSQLGPTTAGTWSVYVDGSDIGLGNPSENTSGVAVDPGGNVYLGTTGGLSVRGLSAENEDVSVFAPDTLGARSTGQFQADLYFEGALFGLEENQVAAVDLPFVPEQQPSAVVRRSSATAKPARSDESPSTIAAEARVRRVFRTLRRSSTLLEASTGRRNESSNGF